MKRKNSNKIKYNEFLKKTQREMRRSQMTTKGRRAVLRETVGFLSCKGAGQIDYIIAIGIFIILLGVTITYLTNYFTIVEDPIRVITLRSEANSLLDIADRGFFPENWTNEIYPDRIGLQSDAYRFFILVNNTQTNLINQSQAVADIVDELVSFNYTYLGFSGIDYNSTAIYNGRWLRSSSFIRSKIRMFASTAIPTDRMKPEIPGNVSVT
jgi:hypothetical protein